jgi:hypothetical protein
MADGLNLVRLLGSASLREALAAVEADGGCGGIFVDDVYGSVRVRASPAGRCGDVGLDSVFDRLYVELELGGGVVVRGVFRIGWDG